MTPNDELIFLSTSELLSALIACCEFADREFGHERADECLVIALLRAADPQEEFSASDAAAFVLAYRRVERFYA